MSPVTARLGDHTILVVADQIGDGLVPAVPAEGPVSSRMPDLTEAIDAAAAATRKAAQAFFASGTTSVTVEVGLEFAIESGTIFAVLGKASAAHSMKVVVTYEHPPGIDDASPAE